MKPSTISEADAFEQQTRTDSGSIDVDGPITVRTVDADEVVLDVDLQAGDHLMQFVTRAGTLPVERLMLQLVEWPSLERVPCGPFDFDHTESRMVVPTFRLLVDGEDQGLVWAEVPSYFDVEDRRLRAQWGVHIRETGRHVITLRRPADEDRLDFSHLESLAVAPNPRQPRATRSRRDQPLRRPRIATDPAQLDRLKGELDPAQQVLLRDMIQQLEEGWDGTYRHRTVTAALVGALTGERRWIDEAIDRAMRTCDRAQWGYHDVPEIMGWNNDRDTGMRLFETAVVYDHLYEHLTDAQRGRMAERLGHFAALVDRVTRLQDGYWYKLSAEAHGHGVWFGFIAAALALLGEDPRAQGWLDWAHGNICDAVSHLPADGIVSWPVFNIQWLILSVMLLERYTGEPLEMNDRPLRRFVENIPHHLSDNHRSDSHRGVVPLLLFFLASRHRDATAQGNALARANMPRGVIAFHEHFHPLTLLAYDPTVPAGEPTRPQPMTYALKGEVVCGSLDGRSALAFTCGSPLGVEHHDKQPWLAQSWCGVGSSGSFSWSVDGSHVLTSMVKTYRKQTGLANVISIDDGGHITHGRYLGGRIPVERTARILRVAHLGGVTCCDADPRPSYTDACDLETLRRQWVFFDELGVMAMRDIVEMTQPHMPAWNLNCGGSFEEVGGLFRASRRRASLWIGVHLRDSGEGVTLQHTIRRASYVPTYTQGLNRYKSSDWQPEINIERTPPDYAQLVLRPSKQVRRFELLSLMGPDEQVLRAAEAIDEEGVCGWRLPGGREVRWLGGEQSLEGLAQRVEAIAAVRGAAADAGRRWLLFGLEQGGGGVVDAIWDHGAESPTVVEAAVTA